MELTVKIKNKKMYNSFVQFFKSLNITVVSSNEKQHLSNKTKKEKSDNSQLPISYAKKNADFKALAGIWENRKITVDELRQSSWGNRK